MRGRKKTVVVALTLAGLAAVLAGGGIAGWVLEHGFGRAGAAPGQDRAPGRGSAPGQDGTVRQVGSPGQSAGPAATEAMWPWPASNAAPLLSGKEDWSTPPEKAEVALPLGELPAYAGWYRYINAGWYNGALCLVADGLAFVDADKTLHAFDAMTGEERWQAQYTGLEMISWLSAADGMLYVDGSSFICAASLQDGRERWRHDGLTLLGHGNGGVWGYKREFGDTNVTRISKLVFLDAHSGKSRTSFTIPAVSDQSIACEVDTDSVALKLKDKVRVFFSGGKTLDLPLHRTDWQVTFGCLPDGLIVAEEALIGEEEREKLTGEEDYERRLRELALDPKTGKPGPGCVLYCYDLPSGKLRWRHELSVEQRDQYCGGGDDISCVESYAIMKCSKSALALRLTDGTLAAEIKQGKGWDFENGQFLELGPADDGRFYYYCYVWEEGKQYLCCLRASTLEKPLSPEQRMDLPRGFCPCYGITAGRLTGMVETPGPTRPAGENRALVSFKLDRQGLLIPGKLQVLSAPPLPDALRARFLSSPDPRQDDALLRAVVSGGGGALMHIARGVSITQTAHLDALAALAAYMDQHAPGGNYGEAGELLYVELDKKAAPELAPQVVRWMGDASLACQREHLLDLLARCGGPEAQRVLDVLYDAGQAQRHVQPAPPYALSQSDLESSVRDDYGKKSGVWAEAKGWGKSKFAVFPAAGLLSDRDIYYAFDKDGDGRWDELLPTGLMDFSYYYMHPCGAAGPGPKGPLALALGWGKLRITHHKPVFKPETEGEGENKETYMRFADAERVTTALSLKDLRRDSDGDGLTDTTERMLLTDPNNADADGDGLSDSEDPTPLADPAKMGKLERGIARALKRCLESEKLTNPQGSTYGSQYLQPWRANYIVAYGCEPVAYCTEPQEYGICLSTRELRKAYEAAVSDYPGLNYTSVSYWRKGMTPEEARAASRGADVEPSGASNSAVCAATEVGGAPRDAAVALEVHFDFATSGEMVQLVEVAGEYYPAGCEETWIS
jgi:outer membrane protein assembly factor BamB